MISIIAQGVTFAAHIAEYYKNNDYYACSLVSLPMLMTSWWYFGKPPQRLNRPVLIWLVYSLIVVVFETVTIVCTSVGSANDTLINVANVFTPVVFLFCIVVYDKQCLKNVNFVIIACVTLCNAFDATDILFAVVENRNKIPASYCGGFVAMASILLVWSSLEFTIRVQTEHTSDLSNGIVAGLHLVHLALDAVILGLRIVMYTNEMVVFSVFIAKNVMVIIVRFIYMISICQRRPQFLDPPDQPVNYGIPSAPPLEIDREFLQRHLTPLPSRANLIERQNTHQTELQNVLYPSISKHVRFTSDQLEQPE